MTQKLVEENMIVMANSGNQPKIHNGDLKQEGQYTEYFEKRK